MRRIGKPPTSLVVHAQVVWFGWSAGAVLAFSLGIHGRVIGGSDEYTMWSDVGFFFAIVAVVVGGILSLLALGICNGSRVAHVTTVVLYGIFALNWMPRIELGSIAWPFLIAITPAIAGLVLLLLPSSRAWCYGQRSNATSTPEES